jgi:hypothetical protein
MATVCRQGTSFRLRGGSKRLYNNNDVIIIRFHLICPESEGRSEASHVHVMMMVIETRVCGRPNNAMMLQDPGKPIIVPIECTSTCR